MTDRERLIELLVKFRPYDNPIKTMTERIVIEKIADYLLANGVIVPPCKVGDKVYFLNNLWHIVLPRYTIYPAKIIGIKTTKLETSFEIQIHNETGCWDIPNCKLGKNLFLTKEEAEQKLKELNKGE